MQLEPPSDEPTRRATRLVAVSGLAVGLAYVSCVVGVVIPLMLQVPQLAIMLEGGALSLASVGTMLAVAAIIRVSAWPEQRRGLTVAILSLFFGALLFAYLFAISSRLLFLFIFSTYYDDIVKGF